LAAWLAAMTVLWGALLLTAGAWGRRHALPAAPSAALPLVSIVIPARDEARNVAGCVRAALAQVGAEFEVVVVDDESADGTAAVALAAGGGDPRLRVVLAEPRPPGWSGKAWACWSGAGLARGALLLFVDADVTLAPGAVHRAGSVLVARGLGMVSLFGSWTLGSWWEHVAIPVVGSAIRGALPVDRVNDPSDPAAFANGQFILVERDAYLRSGGHSAVRAEVLDDVALAGALKRSGAALGLYAAPDLFQVRLYRSFREIVAGYGKNLVVGLGGRRGVAVGLAGVVVAAGVAPVAHAALGWIAPGVAFPGAREVGSWRAWSTAVVGLMIAFRARLDLVEGRTMVHAWTHPIGNAVLAGILVRAAMSRRATWKGRNFVAGRVA
jgi:hypothetical protein